MVYSINLNLGKYYFFNKFILLFKLALICMYVNKETREKMNLYCCCLDLCNFSISVSYHNLVKNISMNYLMRVI